MQGVGFRYKTVQIAKGFEINGEVKNLNDGRVYLQVEGEQTEVMEFKEEIEKLMENFIRNVEFQSSQREPAFKGFIIAH